MTNIHASSVKRRLKLLHDRWPTKKPLKCAKLWLAPALLLSTDESKYNFLSFDGIIYVWHYVSKIYNKYLLSKLGYLLLLFLVNALSEAWIFRSIFMQFFLYLKYQENKLYLINYIVNFSILHIYVTQLLNF